MLSKWVRAVFALFTGSHDGDQNLVAAPNVTAHAAAQRTDLAAHSVEATVSIVKAAPVSTATSTTVSPSHQAVNVPVKTLRHAMASRLAVTAQLNVAKGRKPHSAGARAGQNRPVSMTQAAAIKAAPKRTPTKRHVWLAHQNVQHTTSAPNAAIRLVASQGLPPRRTATHTAPAARSNLVKRAA